MKTSIFVLFACLFLSCSKENSVEANEPTLTGSWSGIYVGNHDSVIVTLDIIQNDGQVTGAGTVTTGNTPYAATVSGSYENQIANLTIIYYKVTLTFTGKRISDITILGKFSDPPYYSDSSFRMTRNAIQRLNIGQMQANSYCSTYPPLLELMDHSKHIPANVEPDYH